MFSLLCLLLSAYFSTYIIFTTSFEEDEKMTKTNTATFFLVWDELCCHAIVFWRCFSSRGISKSVYVTISTDVNR